MKNLSIIGIIATFILISCGSEDDLQVKKDALADLESQIKDLKNEANELKEEIAILDPSLNEVVKSVTVIDVKEVEYNHYLKVAGTSYSKNNVQVTTDMGGLVKAIYVDEGKYVQSGTTLFQLDNSTILPQIAELETALDLAKSVYDKRASLWEQNIGSEIEYLQAKNQYESLEDKLVTVNAQLYKTAIKAPISGYVDAVNLRLGEMASPGQSAAQVVNLTEMEVHAQLAEVYLGTVSKGDKIMVTFPANGIEKEATVKSVAQNINTTNRTFKVIASIDNKDSAVKPNMLAEIKINDLKIEKAITIPSKLIQQSLDGYYVFVAKGDSTSSDILAERAMVTTGSTYEGQTVIKTGLKTGDVVIEEGYRDVLPSSKVNIVE